MLPYYFTYAVEQGDDGCVEEFTTYTDAKHHAITYSRQHHCKCTIMIIGCETYENGIKED